MRLDDRQPDDAEHRLLRAGRSPLALTIALAAALAGCGDSTHPRPRAAARCPARLAHARVVDRVGAVVTCLYATGDSRVRLVVDGNPQAWRRWNATQVERTQATMEWAHTPSQAPHDVPGLGAGAFWVSGPRLLIATDGRRLVTVTVRHPAAQATARRLARRVAAAALGPVHVPVASGP